MAEPSWLIYAGAIAGAVGAVSGVAGAILAWLAFRRTGQIKALDMRLELRRTESTLQAQILGLVPLLEHAKASRTRLAAAQGSYHSGATKHWLSQWDGDREQADALVAGATALDVDCSAFSQSQLEQRLVTVHKLQREIGQLVEKYRASIAKDDIGREHLRQDQREAMQVRRDDKEYRA